MLCPIGYYCPDYLQKIECPEGTWCKAGFVEPLDCHPMVTCPAGSDKQLAGVGAIIGTIFLLACLCGCSGFLRVRAVNEARRVSAEAAKIQDGDLVLGEGFSQDTPSVGIEFEDVGMTLKSTGQCVLSGVTGSFPAGSLVALMGPSGGGKTTFMNALCGRASYGNVTGKIKINGKPGGVQDFPKLVGFVPQDDIMHGDLTVHQNLYYNAQLRLPAATKAERVLEHVNQTLKVLGLAHIAHSIVGDPERRGISGGQKKRVNIGMELVAMPSVIFMDEPTSGLDGAATVQLAKCLKELRRSGLTIICVIHQPRWAVYETFSHLLLLGAGGKMVFGGESQYMERYFNDHGFLMPSRENPADWMIDIVCGLVPRYKSTADAETREEDVSFTAPDDLFKLWDREFKGTTNPYQAPISDWGEPLTADRATPGRVRQMLIFLRRCARQWSMQSFMSTIALLFLCGTVFGALMQSLAEFSYASLFPMLTGNGFIFFMITTVNSRAVFGYERLQYLREFKSGTSCLSYWLGKMLFNLINVFMYSFAYALPLYWIQPVPAMGFSKYLSAFVMAAWYHTGLGMMFSVVFSDPTTSLLMCVFVPMILQLAFAGTLIKIEDMSALQKALSALSCGRWYNQELYLRELKEYPPHVLEFTAVSDQLKSMQATLEDAGQGLFALAILGVALRIWVLIVFALLKNSEGGSCITQFRFVLGKQMDKLGIGLFSGPKRGDTVQDAPAFSRQPSHEGKLGVGSVAQP